MQSVRKYISSIILLSTFFVAEIHTFWERPVWTGVIDGVPTELTVNDAGQIIPLHKENWILRNYVPMSIQWNVKYATTQLIYVMWFLAWLLYFPNRVNRFTVALVASWVVLDGLMYFYNYKRGNYGVVYFWLAFIWLWFVIYKMGSDHRQKNLHQ